jgi:hypothetical protein
MSAPDDCLQGKICLASKPEIDCPPGYYCLPGTKFLPYNLLLIGPSAPSSQYKSIYDSDPIY